jgi:hypothetical protein
MFVHCRLEYGGKRKLLAEGQMGNSTAAMAQVLLGSQEK